MPRLLSLLALAALLAACAGAPPKPEQATAPPLTPAPTAAQTPAEAEPEAAVGGPAEDPYALLAPCLPEARTPEALQARMARAFEARDARCHTSAEIALGLSLLEARDLEEGALHLRQAELRANRHALDDLAAVALLSRARVALAAGEPEPALSLLERAARAADLHTLSTGEAPEALDAVHLKRAVESLAQWERTGDVQGYEAALSSVQRIQGRAALRAFEAAGVSPDGLLAAAGLSDAAARRRRLAEVSATLRTGWGPEVRRRAPERLQLAEALLDAAPVWTAQAPLLLDWLPGDAPGLLTTVQSVLAEGEALVVLAAGPEYGVRMVLGPRTLAATPLPGREALERLAARCEAGDCAGFSDVLLGDAGAGRTQLLLAADGPLLPAPLEAAVPEGVRGVRGPSPLGAAGVRLRAWDGRPAAHPEAGRLLPTGEPTGPDAPAQPGGLALVPDRLLTAPDGPAVLAAVRAALSAGDRLVEIRWEPPQGAPQADAEEATLYGVPLTVPVAEPNGGEVPSGADEAPSVETR